MSICYFFFKGVVVFGSDSFDKKVQGFKGGGNVVKVSYQFFFCMLNINNIYICIILVYIKGKDSMLNLF